MGMNRRGFLGALLSIPFAKPALRALMLPVSAVASRYARYKAMRLKKEQALWTHLWSHIEEELWKAPK